MSRTARKKKGDDDVVVLLPEDFAPRCRAKRCGRLTERMLRADGVAEFGRYCERHMPLPYPVSLLRCHHCQELAVVPRPSAKRPYLTCPLCRRAATYGGVLYSDGVER